MAVDPTHQRQSVGSMLMKIFCGYVVENALDAFVLSTPAGIPLAMPAFGYSLVLAAVMVGLELG